MKTLFLSILFSFLAVAGFSQDLNIDIHPDYRHSITRDKISQARSMSDIIPYYPSSWIKSYASVQLTTNHDGLAQVASSKDEKLTDAQLEMLNSLDYGDEVVIDIDFQYDASMTSLTVGKINYPVTLVPETEAFFPDGRDQLHQYLKGNAIDKISEKEAKDLQMVTVSFTIDEAGEIAGAKVSTTSGNPEFDRLLLEAMSNMPRWKPAEDSEGHKVRQNFELVVTGNTGC
jgi:TonB family protein